MKKLGILILLLGLCVGCAHIKYTTSTGETFEYTRAGQQTFTGFSLTRTGTGTVSISFDKQEGTGGNIAETMKNVSELLVNTSRKVP